jgi:hypothetical protein
LILIVQVADLGCGSGSLLSLLSLPAYHLDDFPPSISSFSPIDNLTSPQQAKLDVLASLPTTPPQERELHLKRLVGVDMSAEACETAAKNCSRSIGKDDKEKIGNETRWEELEMEVWLGGVESENEKLKGVEAIVLTEVCSFTSRRSRPLATHSTSQVIEHLTEEALSRLPSLLFSG